MRRIKLTPEDAAIAARNAARGLPTRPEDTEREEAAAKRWRKTLGYLGPVHAAAAETLRYEQEHGWWGDRARQRRKKR